ncbi:hypothetical protein D2E26_0590 [Bifidobacterium dolichotidis]|uniref:Colicin transporter n=1 Tax=Bifidobacterium dolichotidis TaxID=2306976 RepID=A0A430FT78_9BIFI|nr:hypothetical protein [Bifidobacterium dolichotidis]RSX56027.1 hypothetical protein D2E26_0590 [Bifidobacterium dolichotidis]
MSDEQSEKKKHSRLFFIVAIIAIIVCVLIHSRFSQARTSCNEARELVQQQQSAFDDALSSDQVTQASETDKDQVQDPKLIDSFNKISTSSVSDEKIIECNASSTKQLKNQESQLRKQADRIKQQTQNLNDSANKVIKSRDAKFVEDMHNQVQAKIREAQSLLDQSNGKVTEEQTRQDLQEYLKQADQPSAYKDEDATDKTIEEISVRMKLVEDSMQVYEDQQKAQAQAPAPSGTSGAPTTSGSGSSSYSYSGGHHHFHFHIHHHHHHWL